jgi:hypothetical protein
MENQFIMHLKLEYDKIKLREEFRRLDFKTFFTSPNIKDTWLRATLQDTNDYPIIDSLHKKFKGSNIIAFTLRPNAYVHMHTDPKTRCAVNIILSDDYGPAIFEEFGEVKYECALFNNSRMHMVPAYPKERLLLMFAYLENSYEEIRDQLKLFSLDRTTSLS